MPIYEYRCRNGHNFEVLQRMVDDPVTKCEVCSAPVERVFHPVAVHFKGSGFYTTDYAKKGAAKAGGDSGAKADSDSGTSKAKKDSDSSRSDSGAKSSSSGSASGGSGKSD